VSKDKFYKTIIEVSIDGKWDADAVSLFQRKLTTLLSEEIIEFTDFLENNFSKSEIHSLFFFYFDGLHPEWRWKDGFPGYFSKIKSGDMMKIIEEEFDNVMSKSDK